MLDGPCAVLTVVFCRVVSSCAKAETAVDLSDVLLLNRRDVDPDENEERSIALRR
jgi:hypothetical protein